MAVDMFIHISRKICLCENQVNVCAFRHIQIAIELSAKGRTAVPFSAEVHRRIAKADNGKFCPAEEIRCLVGCCRVNRQLFPQVFGIERSPVSQAFRVFLRHPPCRQGWKVDFFLQ